MIEYYQPESGLAVSALEKGIIVEGMKEYETLLGFKVSLLHPFENEIKSMEVQSIADSPELNTDNPYDVDPSILTRFPPSYLKGLNFYNSSKKLQSLKSHCPPLITFLCNVLEFIKLREHLLLSVYETGKLTGIFTGQQGLVSNNSFLTLNEPILSKKLSQNPYTSNTVCNQCNLNLPVKEFDPELQHLLCFHSPKCIKLIVSTLRNIGLYFRFGRNKSCATLSDYANANTSNIN